MKSKKEVEKRREAANKKAKDRRIRTGRYVNTVWKEDVPKIARMFFVDELEPIEIASELGYKEAEIRDILTAQSKPDDWSSAVIDLIVSGVDVTKRSLKGYGRSRKHTYRDV